jgi:type II secretory pathway predicted ATPase ExeA
MSSLLQAPGPLEEYFGLSQQPFPKAATEACLLRHPGLDDIVERLRFALARDTIALLVAESGCGKSTGLALFAKGLDGNYLPVNTSLTTLSPFGLIASLGAVVGMGVRRFKGDTAAALIAYLRGLSKRVVLIVDEAHLLPDPSLEDLRLLTTEDLDRRSPFSLVLAGQPLLRERLGEPQHTALAQRIGVRVRMRPLTEAETASFLERHLKAAGARKAVFDADASAAIFQHSRGVPRLVQNVALYALLAAKAAGKRTVDASAVQQAALDLDAN